MDTKEFKTLVMPHSGRMYRVACSILRSDNDAQDVVREVLIKLWKQHQKLREVNSIEALAVTITKNLCIDKLRSYKSRFQSDQSNFDSFALDTDSPDEQLNTNQLRYVLESCIDELTPREKQIYKFREFDQLEFWEIQTILGLEQTTVRVTLSRARKKVQKLFSQKTGLIS